MKPRYHYISTNIENMHAEPQHMCEVVSQAIYGTPLTIVDEKELWVQIQTPDKYRGWIRKQAMAARRTPYLSTPSIAQVDALWTHLYQVDDAARSPPVITLPFETKVEIASDPEHLHRHWISFRLIDGSCVWGRRGDFTFNPKLLPLSEMVRLSQRFVGTPYRWGGSSTFGFDCSGFVQALYRQVGIVLSRDAKDQANMSLATAVEREHLQSGDLVFFGSNPPRITHVGMTLDSERFIHATASYEMGHHAIRISSLAERQWEEAIIKACRYF